MDSDVACPICTMTDVLTTASGDHECATCGHEWEADAGDSDGLGETADLLEVEVEGGIGFVNHDFAPAGA